MKRLKKGEFKKMTPEEKLLHKRKLQKEWRDKNKDVVSKRNRYWYERYRATKPFTAICMRCGKKFNATRDYYKTCQECMDEKHLNYTIFVQERKARVEEREKKYKDILYLRSQGLKETQIANILKVTQSTVSYIIRTRKGGDNE